MAGFLAEFVKEFGTEDATGWCVPNFLTHSDVAQLTSVSRQKASQVFSRLKRTKWIDYDKQFIRVKNDSPLFNKKITGLD